MTSLRDQFPLHLVIGTEDCTSLLDDGFTFSNVDPGGFEMCSFVLPKDMPQSIRGQSIRLSSGLQVAWEGRISEIQRSLGNRTAITGEGYGARVKDIAQSMVFIDRDLTRWTDPSLQRQINLLSYNFVPGTSQVMADPVSDRPAIAHQLPGPWAAPYTPLAESWYDAGPENLIAGIAYDLTTAGLGFDPAWLEQVVLSPDLVVSSNEASANLYTQQESIGLFAPARPQRYALLDHRYTNTPAGGAGAIYTALWHNLAVIGNHGLPLRYPPGSPTSGPPALYPSDIVRWVLTQIPGLQPGSISLTDASGYLLPHSVYRDPVSLDVILNDMAKASGWNWSVWESPNPLLGDPRPRLDFQPRPADGTWQTSALRSQCETLDIKASLAGLYDQAVVGYTTVDGTNSAVTASVDNPYLDQSGIGRGANGPGRMILLNAGTIGGLGYGTAAQQAATVAQAYGVVCLRLLMAQARTSGQITISTAIQDSTGGPMAPWMLRAGQQRLRIPDLPANDYAGAHSDLPITRVEASVSAEALSTSVAIGQGASLLETFQARESTAAQIVGL